MLVEQQQHQQVSNVMFSRGLAALLHPGIAAVDELGMLALLQRGGGEEDPEDPYLSDSRTCCWSWVQCTFGVGDAASASTKSWQGRWCALCARHCRCSSCCERLHTTHTVLSEHSVTDPTVFTQRCLNGTSLKRMLSGVPWKTSAC